jgi:hypothetical protein
VDVSNAFLNGVLAKRVYCQQPMEFVNRDSPDHVCQLSKSPSGLPRSQGLVHSHWRVSLQHWFHPYSLEHLLVCDALWHRNGLSSHECRRHYLDVFLDYAPSKYHHSSLF